MEPDHLSKRFRAKRSISERSKREAPYVIYPEILCIVDYDGYRYVTIFSKFLFPRILPNFLDILEFKQYSAFDLFILIAFSQEGINHHLCEEKNPNCCGFTRKFSFKILVFHPTSYLLFISSLTTVSFIKKK